MLQAYLSYISDLDSTRYESIYYYVRYAQEASISNIMLNMFNKRALRAIMFVMLNK